MARAGTLAKFARATACTPGTGWLWRTWLAFTRYSKRLTAILPNPDQCGFELPPSSPSSPFMDAMSDDSYVLDASIPSPQSEIADWNVEDSTVSCRHR